MKYEYFRTELSSASYPMFVVDSRWGIVGAFGTGVMFWGTTQFAHHAAYTSYETADGLRVGFQMHNVLGNPGRKIEASPANIVRGPDSTWGFSNKLVPLRISGMGKVRLSIIFMTTVLIFFSSLNIADLLRIRQNVLIDSSGKFYGNNRLISLIDRANIGKAMVSEADVGAALEEKQKRIELLKSQAVAHKKKKKV